MPAYIRPLGEPNRCLNVYAAYECAGKPREAADSARNYRRAFRRIYVIVHGGGKAKVINARLKEAGLPPLTVEVGGLPKAPVAIVWSPLPSGSPTTKKNLPQNYFPGEKWVDWTGTDFYASYPEWGALTRLYERYPDKPFALTEWGVENGDDPAFVSKLFTWVEKHPRTKMVVYYQDFGSTSPTGSRTTRKASRCSPTASTRVTSRRTRRLRRSCRRRRPAASKPDSAPPEPLRRGQTAQPRDARRAPFRRDRPPLRRGERRDQAFADPSPCACEGKCSCAGATIAASIFGFTGWTGSSAVMLE